MMVHHDSFGFNAHENIISVYELHCSERVFCFTVADTYGE